MYEKKYHIRLHILIQQLYMSQISVGRNFKTKHSQGITKSLYNV